MERNTEGSYVHYKLTAAEVEYATDGTNLTDFFALIHHGTRHPDGTMTIVFGNSLAENYLGHQLEERICTAGFSIGPVD